MLLWKLIDITILIIKLLLLCKDIDNIFVLFSKIFLYLYNNRCLKNLFQILWYNSILLYWNFLILIFLSLNIILCMNLNGWYSITAIYLEERMHCEFSVNLHLLFSDHYYSYMPIFKMYCEFSQLKMIVWTEWKTSFMQCNPKSQSISYVTKL